MSVIQVIDIDFVIVRARQLRLCLYASGWNDDIFSRRSSICIEQLTTNDCLKRTNVSRFDI